MEASTLLLGYDDVLFDLFELLGDLGNLLLVGVDFLIHFDYLLPFNLLPIHLLQILHLNILVPLLIFPHCLLLLILYKLYLLVVQRIQLPLLVIVLPYLLQLCFFLLDLSVEALRSQQLIGLGFNLQILVLHDFLDVEFAITDLADIALDLGLCTFPLQLARIRHRPSLVVILLYLYVRRVHGISALLIAALRAVLEGAEVT